MCRARIMEHSNPLRAWYRHGHWFDTPQGVIVLLSLPVCWLTGLASVLWADEPRPLFLDDSPALYFIAPVLAFLYFLRVGVVGGRGFRSSWWSTAVITVIVAVPFVLPYLR